MRYRIQIANNYREPSTSYLRYTALLWRLRHLFIFYFWTETHMTNALHRYSVIHWPATVAFSDQARYSKGCRDIKRIESLPINSNRPWLSKTLQGRSLNVSSLRLSPCKLCESDPEIKNNCLPSNFTAWKRVRINRTRINSISLMCPCLMCACTTFRLNTVFALWALCLCWRGQG